MRKTDKTHAPIEAKNSTLKRRMREHPDSRYSKNKENLTAYQRQLWDALEQGGI